MRTSVMVLVLLACACSDGGPQGLGARDLGDAGGSAASGGASGAGAFDAGGSVADAAAELDASAEDAASSEADAEIEDASTSDAEVGEVDVPPAGAPAFEWAGYGSCRIDSDCYGDERCVSWPAQRDCADNDDCPDGSTCRALSVLDGAIVRRCMLSPCEVIGDYDGFFLFSCSGDAPGPSACARPCSDATDCADPAGDHTSDAVCEPSESACRLECGEQLIGPTRTCPDGMVCTVGVCEAA